MANSSEDRKLSKNQLFKVFLKTGRKRIILSIISGTIIFLTITCLIMVVYSYRYQSFQEYEQQTINWYNDGKISIGSNYIESGSFSVEDGYFDNITAEFISTAENLIPNLNIYNSSSAFSAEVFEYDPTIPGEPWLLHEIMTFDNTTFSVVEKCLVEGRLPRNATELLWVQNNVTGLMLNDTELIFSVTELNSDPLNYTIVGVVSNLAETFVENNVSADLLDWEFDNIEFYNYDSNNLFLTNMSLFNQVLNNFSSYYGTVTNLVDVKYDFTALKLNQLSKYVAFFPTANALLESEITGAPIELLPDLKAFFIAFSNFWVAETTKILSINSPLFFIIGLLTVVALNIGSKDLASSFRRMKIYGLSYNSIRQMVIKENLLFTSVSFLGGTAFGIGVSFLFTMNISDSRNTFFSGFLTEPLLLISLAAFILSFFALSFFIQNSIARTAAKTTSEEYMRKRSRFRSIFSSNEFRLLVIALIFSGISIILYLVLLNAETSSGFTSGLSYMTLFWFMISISISFLITFVFLIIARLTTFLWELISRQIWPKNMNFYSLSVKHLSVSKSSYQLALMSVLIFGLVIIPGVSMNTSIQKNVQNEAALAMGGSTLIVPRWVDPDNELDVYLDNITEISSYTEATIYRISDNNEFADYPNAFTFNLLGLEDPSTFVNTINTYYINKSSTTVESVLELEEDQTILMDKAFARKNKLKPGEIYSTDSIARFSTDLTFIDSFNYFPLSLRPIRVLFARNFDSFSIIANKETARDIVSSLGLNTEITSYSVKIFKSVNESAIPFVQQQISTLNVSSLSYNELLEEMTYNIDNFSQNNLMFFAILSSLTLIFVSYFTGLKIFDERGRLIEALYRVGAERRKIVGFFTFEYFLLNLIPLIVAIFSSLPLISVLALSFLGAEDNYYTFRPNISWWVFIVVILLGLALALVGWLIAIIPAIKKYRPVKQE